MMQLKSDNEERMMSKLTVMQTYSQILNILPSVDDTLIGFEIEYLFEY